MGEKYKMVARVLLLAIPALAYAQDKTIVETAQATAQLSSLVTALTLEGQKEVLGVLSGDGPFTVFAPTNGGFEALKTLKNADGVTLYDFVTNADNAAILTKILQYHVVAGKVESGAAIELGKKNGEAGTLLGEKITLSLKGDNLVIDSSQVTTPDVMAKNGVVHLIDNVLVPPSLRDAVAAFKAVQQQSSTATPPSTPTTTATSSATSLV